MKKLLASVTVAGLLATGGASLAAGATAWAADPGGSGADQPPSSGAPGQKGQRGERAQLAIQTAAATIGVAPDDLRSQIKAGKTIAQVATEHGVDPANVVNAVIAALSQQIDQAAAQGTVDANRAAQAKQKLPDFVNRFVNETKAGKGGGHRFLKSAVKAAAKEIGISEADLKKALKDGKTIAQVAKDHDTSVDDVVNAVVKAAKSDIDQAVKDGKLDSKRADELKKKLPDKVKKFVNGERRKNRRKGSDTPATTKAT